MRWKRKQTNGSIFFCSVVVLSSNFWQTNVDILRRMCRSMKHHHVPRFEVINAMKNLFVFTLDPKTMILLVVLWNVMCVVCLNHFGTLRLSMFGMMLEITLAYCFSLSNAKWQSPHRMFAQYWRWDDMYSMLKLAFGGDRQRARPSLPLTGTALISSLKGAKRPKRS